MTDENKCRDHKDHENRIKRLEVTVDKLVECQKSPAVLVAIIGLIGTAMATAGSVVGVVLAAYLKGQGLI